MLDFGSYKNVLEATTGTSRAARIRKSEPGGGAKPGAENGPKILPEPPTESEGRREPRR
jgi:hypothetical protein